MSHAIMVPVTGQGTVVDRSIASYLPALLQSDFGCTDVVVYSHGWWTTAQSAMVDYARFSVGLLGEVLLRAQAGGRRATALEVGIHWPAMISEDSESVIDVLQPLTYYNRAAMADDVGEHGGQSILRLIVENAPRDKPLNVHLIGHSFGCRVVCSTLVQLLAQVGPAALEPHRFNLVLLQGAFDTDALEPGKRYGTLLNADQGVPNLRLLVTRSHLDVAVGDAYPAAYRLVNLFGKQVTGIGFTGPSRGTPGAREAFNIEVPAGYQPEDMRDGRFYVADLSPLHRDPSSAGLGGKFAGHHSDIYRSEVYRLLAAFMF